MLRKESVRFRSLIPDRRNQVLAGILTAVFVLLFYSYIYGDITTTARMGITFWDDLFAGNIRKFYQTRVYMTTAAYAQDVWATYDFPIYIIFAMWNFPLWLLERFGNVDVMNNWLCLLWVKTMLLPFLFYFIRSLYGLCIEQRMTVHEAAFTCLLFLSSDFVVGSMVIISQYDIIEMCFILSGIRAYLHGDLKKFCGWFAIAISIKLFALFIFLPLLVFREKRILRVIDGLICTLLPLVLFRILIPTASDNLDENGLMMLRFPFEYQAHLGLNTVYLFPLCMGAIILVCFFLHEKEANRFFPDVCLICFAVYFAEFSTMMAFPYWLVMMAPWMNIMTVQNRSCRVVNAVLELLMTAGLTFAQMYRFDWCFDSNTASGMYWPLILGKKPVNAPLSAVSLLAGITSNNADKIVEHFIGLGSTVFVGCGLLFLLFNLPTFIGKCQIVQERPEWRKAYLCLRVLVCLITGIVPLALYCLA